MNNESSSSRTQSCIIIEYSLTRQGEQTFGFRRQTEQVCGRGRGNITLINRLAPTSVLQIFRTEVVILRHSYAILRHSYAILRQYYVHSTVLLRTFYATFSPPFYGTPTYILRIPPPTYPSVFRTVIRTYDC